MNHSPEHINIEHFLPHRPPMLMVKALTYIDETSAITSFQILEDCIFVANDILSETGLSKMLLKAVVRLSDKVTSMMMIRQEIVILWWVI